ncbi:MAG: SurA N-terminal domain-containing protein [Paracoccaceae bacterium]
MSSKLRNNKGKNSVIWVLMGLMVAGLGGYGVTNFGASVNAIGSVGGREVDLRDYARALNQEISAMSAQIGTPLTFPQAQQLGLTDKVRAQLFATAALEDEADDLGLSVGDAEVRRAVTSIQAFRGIDGSFDRDAYKLTLRQQGLTEAEFETRLRSGIGARAAAAGGDRRDGRARGLRQGAGRMDERDARFHPGRTDPRRSGRRGGGPVGGGAENLLRRPPRGLYPPRDAPHHLCLAVARNGSARNPDRRRDPARGL